MSRKKRLRLRPRQPPRTSRRWSPSAAGGTSLCRKNSGSRVKNVLVTTALVVVVVFTG